MYVWAFGAFAAVLLVAGVSPARAEILAYTDQNGRQIFINTEDVELTQAVRRGGVPAAARLMERRKRALPGIEQHIEEVSSGLGVDPALVHALIEVESAWNPTARSSKGALGLMQLMPGTAARFGVRDLFDPRQNIAAGVRYLRFLLDRFHNNLEWALAAYNAGENAVEAAKGIPPFRETINYIQRLRSLYAKLGPGRGRPGHIFSVVEQGRIVYVNE